MKQITVRGIDKELERRILDLAGREGLSLNKAILRLLRRAAGLSSFPAVPTVQIGDGLNKYIGTWTQEQEQELFDGISSLEQIDPELWK